MTKSTVKRTFTPEHRANLSKVHKGKPLSAEHKAKISKALTGRKVVFSEEHLLHLREMWARRKEQRLALLTVRQQMQQSDKEF